MHSTPFIKCKFLGKKEALVCKKSDKLLATINAFAQGVRAYDTKLNIVKTSINLSTLKMQNKKIQIELFARSNTLEGLESVEFESKIFFESFGFKTQSSNFYAPWEGKENAFSKAVLQALKSEVKNAKITAVHAGLECGILEKKQKLLCACLGINIHNPHSVDERCELKSVEKISKVLRKIVQDHQ